MRRILHGCLAIVIGLAVAAGVAGCSSEGVRAEREAERDAQFAAFDRRAVSMGAAIVAQIPAGEIAVASDRVGGARWVDDLAEEGPRYSYWGQDLILHGDGPRTPSEVASDLDPWLRDEGWRRMRDLELPSTSHSFMRSYVRDGYRLTLDVSTEPVHRAQTIMFTIISPTTD